MTIRFKPTSQDQNGNGIPDARELEIRRHRAAINAIKEQFPGITDVQANQMLDALEARQKEEARKKYEGAMGTLAPPPAPAFDEAGEPIQQPVLKRKEKAPMYAKAADPGRAQPIQPQPQGTVYGAGLNNSDKQPGIWIDQDGDGVNDRYQRGPGQRNEGPAAGRKTTPRPAPIHRSTRPGVQYGG